MSARIALVTPNPSFERWVRSAIDAPEHGELLQWREEYLRIDPTKVAAELADDGVDVVCLGPGLPIEDVFDLARAFDRERPDVCVLIVADRSPVVLEEALRVGVRDVLPLDATADRVREAFDRARETADRRKAGRAEPAPAPAPAARVVTVLSPKGGSGKTTLATNVAVACARLLPHRVAIVDLDLQFGDVASALQLAPQHTVANAVHSAEPVDATMLKVFLTSHPTTVYALCAPEWPVDADEVTFDHAAHLLGVLAGDFPVVVVDTGAGLDEPTLAAVQASTDLVLVSSMDVASVRALRKELDVLDRLGLVGPRRHFVLNRADTRVGLDAGDIEAVIGLPVDIAVPSSRAVPMSLNQGVPLAEADPKSPVVQALAPLVERLTGHARQAAAAATRADAAGPRRRRRKREER